MGTVDVYFLYDRATFKLTKQREKVFWLFKPDNANCETCDSDNGK